MMEKPTQLPEINTEAIRKICQEYIDFVDSEDYHEDNDFKDYIYETTMIAVFGEKVFDWINKRC